MEDARVYHFILLENGEWYACAINDSDCGRQKHFTLEIWTDKKGIEYHVLRIGYNINEAIEMNTEPEKNSIMHGPNLYTVMKEGESEGIITIWKPDCDPNRINLTFKKERNYSFDQTTTVSSVLFEKCRELLDIEKVEIIQSYDFHQ